MTALDIYRRAGFPTKHGQAFQEIADDSDRIIISRCAQEIGVGLLEENYASKGFGIKAKSCNWGPFAGFAMGHFQYSKFEKGLDRYKKQIDFFDHSTETGFKNDRIHIQMGMPDTLRLTTKRLEFLRFKNLIKISAPPNESRVARFAPKFSPGIVDGAKVTCDGPYGVVEFRLVHIPGPSDACWAFLHRSEPPDALKGLATDALKHLQAIKDANAGKPGSDPKLKDKELFHGVDPESEWKKWTLVKGMVNALPEDRNMSDPAKNCVAGDYDLWAVFPKKGSSMALHGMDRQVRSFAGVNPNAGENRKTGAFILKQVRALQNDAASRAPERTHVKNVGGQRQEFKYKEDPEYGNVSPLLLDTMHKLNRRIKEKGYRGGRMVHHNDDMGNPYRSDVEKELIAFIPKRGVYFIDDGSYYKFIKEYEKDYAVYDNVAIWGKRA